MIFLKTKNIWKFVLFNHILHTLSYDTLISHRIASWQFSLDSGPKHAQVKMGSTKAGNLTTSNKWEKVGILKTIYVFIPMKKTHFFKL